MRIGSLVLAILFMIGLAATPASAATGDATFYDVGLGACGKTNKNSDLVVAISALRFTLGLSCGRKIKVTRASKSVTVTVVDRCVDCRLNDIDLSPGAFNKIAKLEEGRVKVNWQFIN